MCGSALGLVMMLTTWAWRPPIWAAMLPQKFSAATTWTTRPLVPGAVAPAVEQAARAIEQMTTAAALRAASRVVREAGKGACAAGRADRAEVVERLTCWTLQ